MAGTSGGRMALKRVLLVSALLTFVGMIEEVCNGVDTFLNAAI